MPTPPLPELPDTPASPEVIEIERALTRITYLSTRARQHDRLMALARRAAGPGRRGAAAPGRRLGAAAARGAGQPAGGGGLARHADGAVARVREAGARGMQLALSDWKPEELRQLATLFHRMVDDFLAHAVDEETDQQPTASAGTA